MLVTFVDDTNNTVHQQRPSVCPGEPAAAVLEPEPRVRCRVGVDRILNLKADAAAIIALIGTEDRGRARLRAVWIEPLRIAMTGRNDGGIPDQQHLGSVGTPCQRIGLDVPSVSRFSDRSQD